MTAEELAWLRAVTRLYKGIDKVIHQSATLTRAKMTSDANTLRACSRELARIGSPGDRLQPVYVIVKKACRTFDKGAKCWATAASVSMADGGVIVGTPEERTQRRAIDCGGAAAGNGSNLLFDAESRARRSRPSSGDVVVSGDRATGPLGGLARRCIPVWVMRPFMRSIWRGLPMRFIIDRSAARLAIAVVCVVLSAGAAARRPTRRPRASPP